MLNKAFYRLLTLSSITVYIITLIVIFNIPVLTEKLINLYLSQNYSLEQQKLYLITIGAFLSFPDILAVILYLRSKTKFPEMNHSVSALWRFIIDAFIIIIIMYFLQKFLLSNSDYYQGNRSEIQIAIGMVFGLSFILLWFLEPFRLLRNIVSMQDAHTYLQELLHKPPYINFHVHAYHYETRTRVVTESHTDSEGQTHTTHRTETYQEQVTTLQLKKPYQIEFWRDVTNTRELLLPQRFRIVKIKIETAINAIDLRAQQHYNLEWQNFNDRYKGADVWVDFSVTSGIKGMKTDVLLAFLDLKEQPLFLNIFFYFCASFTPFCMSYCLWLDRFSAVSKKIIFKEYSFNRL